MMKKIALLYMGGTFGCVGEPLTPMPETEFLPKLQNTLPAQYQVDCLAAPVIKDSSACSAADWLLLVQYIQQLKVRYTYFVVIHGTDTLSYAAALLARFLGQSCHVILTGSQYPLLDIQGNAPRVFTDAVDNLYFALEQVSRKPAGVYLAFHQQVFHAQSVMKMHTTELDAFKGIEADQDFPVYKEEISVQDDIIEQAKSFNLISWHLQPQPVEHLIKNLGLLQDEPPHFLILQGFGTGNLAVNQAVIECLQEFQHKGCLPVLATQVPFGSMDQRYAVSSWVKQANILVNNTYSNADLYAKALQIYLKYPSCEQRYQGWSTQP